MHIAPSLLLALVSVVACGGSSPPAAPQTGLADPNVRSQLRSLALQASSGAGVPSPTAILAVSSPDHQAAEKVVSGDIVEDHAPVYVVEVTGGVFTDNQASGPPGAPPPQGSALTLTVNAQTLQVVDFGIEPTAPDLAQIGSAVVNLTR